ncbi:hypothetical protein ACFLWY_04905 [Chloroflexota bacterium]
MEVWFRDAIIEVVLTLILSRLLTMLHTPVIWGIDKASRDDCIIAQTEMAVT